MRRALMLDLTAAQCSGWYWYRGKCKRVGLHSWLEANGWAVDGSNGFSRAVLVMKVETYRALQAATDITIVLV